MKQIFPVIILLSFFSVLASCSPAKKVIGTAIGPKDSLVVIPNVENKAGMNLADSTRKKLVENYIDFKTFSAKIKVETQDNKGKNPDISAVVRMVKDSAIWISLTATFLNYEVFRVYITPDSLILLDKREKTVQYRSLDYLQEVTAIPFDFNSLQNLLIGNPVFFNSDNAVFQRNENFILASSLTKDFKHLLTLQAGDMNIIHSKLDDVDFARHRTADLTYGEYQSIEGRNFSADRKLIIAEKNKIDAHLNFKQVEFNKELQLNFSVPKNYKIK